MTPQINYFYTYLCAHEHVNTRDNVSTNNKFGKSNTKIQEPIDYLGYVRSEVSEKFSAQTSMMHCIINNIITLQNLMLQFHLKRHHIVCQLQTVA